MSELKTSEKVPWVAIIALCIFLGAFGQAWLQFLPSSLYTYYNFGEIMCVLSVTAGPFIVLIFAGLISRLMKKSFSLTALTYLYVVGMACSWYTNTAQPLEWYEIVASRHMSDVLSAQYVPWFMAPSADITRQIVNGHVPIPWADWIPSTIYHWSFSVLIGLFLISMATLFRRQFIDTEKVPFPHTVLAHELLKRIPEEKKSLLEQLGKPFLAGIVLGLAFQIPVFMTVVFPWFPDIYGWKTLCGAGFWYVRANTPLAGIAGFTTVSEHPVAAAVGYIIPLSITFNVWFWYLVWLVIMQVAYAMGYYTGIESSGGCGRTGWCSPSGMLDPPYKMAAVSVSGGLLGIAIINLVLNRRYIGETLRAAFAKHSSRLEIEKNEALTYRDTYILFGSSTILLLILFMIDGMGFGVSLLIIIGYFLFFLAYSRIYGMAGFATGGDTHGGTLLRLLVFPTAPNPPTQEFVLSSVYSREGVDGPYFSNGSIYTGFASYKMASLTGTSNSSILKILLAAILIVPLVVILTNLVLVYTYGGSTLPGNGGSFGSGVQNTSFSGYSDPVRWLQYPSSEPVLQYVIAGILMVVVLEVLHTSFIWFPFNGIGFVIGMGRISIKWGFWAPFLIAWVLKTLTLRIGGSKLYENVGVPVAAGFVVGYIIAVIFGGAMGVLRFFVPF